MKLVVSHIFNKLLPEASLKTQRHMLLGNAYETFNADWHIYGGSPLKRCPITVPL